MQRTCTFLLFRAWYSYDCPFPFLSFLLPSFCCSFDILRSCSILVCLVLSFCYFFVIFLLILFYLFVFVFVFWGVGRWGGRVEGLGGGREGTFLTSKWLVFLQGFRDYTFVSMHELRIAVEGMDCDCFIIIFTTTTSWSSTVNVIIIFLFCFVLILILQFMLLFLVVMMPVYWRSGVFLLLLLLLLLLKLCEYSVLFINLFCLLVSVSYFSYTSYM